MPAPGPDSDLPSHIGPYRVLRRLGAGATSEVLLGHDGFHDRLVALKRLHLPPGFDTDHGRHGRHCFAAESALAGRLRHPNLVRIFDALDLPGEPPCLVLEYVPGHDLRRHCRPDDLLPLQQVVQIGFKCASALGYMARQGLIHRDVKPANVLALRQGAELAEVKLSDFGSVFNLNAERTQIYRVGSLAYMSPEQLEGDVVDARSDLYSLAALLYHLIAGRAPFEAPNHGALMHQVLNGAPPALQPLRQGVSEPLAALVHAALAKRREDRPASSDAFADALAALVHAGAVPRAGAHELLDSERFQLLRGLPFFAGFGDVELWEVVHRAQWRRHAQGEVLMRQGEPGAEFLVLAEGEAGVWRAGAEVARLDAGASLGEMAYLAPSPALRLHEADVRITSPQASTLGFTPHTLQQLSPGTQHLFDKAFIAVLVRRLHAAHAALGHARRVL